MPRLAVIMRLDMTVRSGILANGELIRGKGGKHGVQRAKKRKNGVGGIGRKRMVSRGLRPKEVAAKGGVVDGTVILGQAVAEVEPRVGGRGLDGGQEKGLQVGYGVLEEVKAWGGTERGRGVWRESGGVERGEGGVGAGGARFGARVGFGEGAFGG